MESITSENWNYCHYQTTQLKAFISIGGGPLPSQESYQTLYMVTVTDHDYQELFQKSFDDLTPALQLINQQYHHWDFVDQTSAEKEGGCSDCQAH